jgi:hypothetical protein
MTLRSHKRDAPANAKKAFLYAEKYLRLSSGNKQMVKIDSRHNASCLPVFPLRAMLSA